MKTKEQREDEFRLDIKKVLDKHGAEIELAQKGREYIQRSIIEISMYAIYDEHGNTTEEYTEFEF